MAKKKVRMLTSIASHDWSYWPGQVVEVDAEIADNWIKYNTAEPVEERGIETASEEEPENAAERTTRRGRKRG